MARSPSPPAPPKDRPGIGDGLRSLFSGFSFIVSTPDVWHLAIVPVAIGLVLTLTLGWAAVALIPPLIQSLFGAPSGALLGVLAVLAKVAATLLAILLAALVGFGLAQPLSGPALERIVRRVEAGLGAPPWPPTSALDDIVRSLQSTLVGAAFGAPLLIALTVVGLIFPPLVVITVPLKVLVTAVLITWDLCDYPLSIRGLPIGQRVSLLARNGGAVLGFGLGLGLLALIPCSLLIVLPAGVAGAARLMVLIERFEQTQPGALPANPPPQALPPV